MRSSRIPPQALVTTSVSTPSRPSTRTPKTTRSAGWPSYRCARPFITATGTAATVPTTSVPECPIAVETGQPGISPYGIVTAILDAIGEAAEARAEDDCDPRRHRDPLPDRVDGLVDHADPSATRASKWETTNSTASAGSSVQRTSSRSEGEIIPSSSTRPRIQSSIGSQ